MAARRGASFGPTSRNSVTGFALSSRNVRPSGGGAGTGPLLDADEGRVERLAALVHLDLHVRVLERQVLLEVTRVRRARFRADKHGHDLVVALDGLAAQGA